MDWKDLAFDIYYDREDGEDNSALLKEMDEELDALWTQMDRRAKIAVLSWELFNEDERYSRYNYDGD